MKRLERIGSTAGALAALVIIAALLSACAGKVNTGPAANTAAELLSAQAAGSPEAILRAIDGLNKSLMQNSSDAALLARRAAAWYELLQLAVDGAADAGDPLKITAHLLGDLRAMDNLSPGLAPGEAWIPANTASLAADMLTVRAGQLAAQCQDDPCRVRVREVYRLALDFYSYAGEDASASLSQAQSDAAFAGELKATLQREIARARYGYASALAGIAQEEVNLKLDGMARDRLRLSRNLVLGRATFPPAEDADSDYARVPRDFYPGTHGLLAVQSASLARLDAPADPASASVEDLQRNLALREFALKEELAQRIFSLTPVDLDSDRIEGADAILTILKMIAEGPS